MWKDRQALFAAVSLTLFALCTLVFSGCSPKPMEMTVVGGPSMNNGGNAAVVRIYQLSSDNNFQRSTVESFWRNDDEALGVELIAPKQEVLLYPDQSKTFEMEIGEDVKFVGVAADLRNPSQDQWKQIFDAEEVRGRKITVTVVDDRLLVEME